MKNRSNLRKSSLSLSAFLAILVFVSLMAAQELVPVRDLTGGNSVFLFRGGSRSVSKRFVTQAKSKRSVQQRADSAKRVNKQFTTLAKVKPRRDRSAVVNPEALKVDLKRISKEEASKLFAGVGEYYMDRNEYDQAIDVFREALDMEKTNTRASNGLSEALALKGNELLAMNSLPVAKKFFDEALTYNKRNAPAYFGLAEIAAAGEKDTDALANYEKALDSDRELTEIFVPLGILYYQSGNFEKADELLTKSVNIEPNDPQAQYFLGLVRSLQNNDTAALAAFNKAKSLDPKLAEAFYYAGETQTRLGNRDAAISDFRAAIALRENYFEAWYGLGTVMFEKGSFDEAIKAFEKAKTLRNDNAEIVANLGDAYRMSEDPKLAQNKYSLAESNYNLAVLFLERRPDFATNTEIRQLTADIYARIAFAIGKQCEINVTQSKPCKWDAAVKALGRGTEINKSDMDYANLGWAYFNAGQTDLAFNYKDRAKLKFEQAKTNLQKSIDTNPKFLDVPLANLGRVYNELGEYPAAITVYRRILEKDPRSVDALNSLGLAYYNSGNYKDAIAQFKKAIDRDKNFAEAYFNLGSAEFKNGNTNEVKKIHSKLKSMNRNDLAAKLQKVVGLTINL